MPTATDPLSLVFHALSDPTRRGILERLSIGDSTVGELRAPFAVSAPAVSQHLRVLEKAGLVERRAQAQWRVCALTPAPLDDAAAWVERNRRVWEGRFDRLDEVLAELHDDGLDDDGLDREGVRAEHDGAELDGEDAR